MLFVVYNMTSEAFINQKLAVNQGLGVFKKRMADAGFDEKKHQVAGCLLYTSPSPRD